MQRLLVLCLAIITGLFTPVYASVVKFIQVTDVHLNQNNSQYLKDFVDDVNQKYSDIDFVVFTGDNIDKPREDDLCLFLDTIKQLKVRAYVLPGNHDLYRNKNLTHDTYMKLVRKKLGAYHSPKPNYVFKKDDIVFITMNGVKEIIPGPNGYYKEDELVWLDKMLSKYADKKVVIFQHFPLLDTPVRSHSLYKKEQYLEILKKHNNVIAVISGHYHQNREVFCNNIYNVVTKNFSNNRYYKLIEIDDGFVYTMLIDNKDLSEGL